MRLTDATPSHFHHLHDGWCITFGEATVGKQIGCVYTGGRQPHYTRFLVVEIDGLAQYQVESVRPLTEDEQAHFAAMVSRRDD